jgi:uncharacterized SAM-dependent methyltransferase
MESMKPESDFEILKNYRDKQEITSEFTQEITNRVLWYLEESLDVNDLTNIELFDIRRDVEQVLRANYELASDFNEQNAKERIKAINEHIMRYPDAEVVNKFLSRYGLHMHSSLKLKNKKEQNAYWEYLKRQLKIARQKAFDPLDESE